MSVNAVGNIVPHPALLPGGVRPDSAEESGVDQRGSSNETAAAEQHRPAPALPAEAPAGTDPALWSVLTSEERGYFAQASALGPLTYGPSVGKTGADAALRGGRVDVRV